MTRRYVFLLLAFMLGSLRVPLMAMFGRRFSFTSPKSPRHHDDRDSPRSPRARAVLDELRMAQQERDQESHNELVRSLSEKIAALSEATTDLERIIVVETVLDFKATELYEFVQGALPALLKAWRELVAFTTTFREDLFYNKTLRVVAIVATNELHDFYPILKQHAEVVMYAQLDGLLSQEKFSEICS
jgi:hypothetical protein